MTYPPPGPNYPDSTGHGAGQQPQQPPPGYGQQPGYSAPYSDPMAPPYGSGPPTGQMPPASGMPYQQPVSSVPGAYQQPVSSVPGYQQPYGAPGYQQAYGAPGFPPPQGPSKAPLIVALALAAVVVLGIGVALVFVLGGSDEPHPVSATGSPSASASPSPSPSPSPSESPSEDSGERLSYQEYDDDWDFKLGATELSADYVKGWDYEDCTEFERGGALSDEGCEYGVEVSYKAEGGKVKISNLFLVMSDQDAAEELNRDIDDKDFTLHKESYLKDFSYGKWQRKFSGKYVVVTICTAAKSVSKEKAGKYLHYMNADMTAALSFR